MSRRSNIRREILNISEGLLATTTDMLLFWIFMGTAAATKSPTSKGVWQAFDAAHKELEGVNYQTIKKGIYRLKRKGLVQYTRETITHPQITKQGLKRLKSLLPSYDKKRVWDKKLYLVTYDIPETKRRERNLLRHYLRKIGCGMLQASVWITPYNPTGVLKDFIRRENLGGAIIISDVGSDGSIGDESIEELVTRVYKLEELNKRYLRFVDKFSQYDLSNMKARERLSFEFLSILADDPQLPFELLPKNWVGNKAYEIFTLTIGRPSSD